MVVLVVIAGAMGVLYLRNWYNTALTSVSSDQTLQEVVVPEGSNTHDIAVLLKEKQLIRSVRAFETYMRGRGDGNQLKAGTYELSSAMSTQEIVSVLIEGKQVSTFFTITPGIRLDQIRKRFLEAGYNETDVDRALSRDSHTDIPLVDEIPAGQSLEGFIYPETFSIDPNSTPTTIIRQSLLELSKLIDEPMRAALSKHGLNVYQAVTLASIVEKEVPAHDDRKIVAQIFLSRLDQGISLGSDATYYYAAAVFGGEPFPDLDSPYNTRIYTGLPPGPINNISASALQAVAYPSETDYLFFVTGDDGVNHFTRTDAEHQQAVRLYCKISCATGYVPENF